MNNFEQQNLYQNDNDKNCDPNNFSLKSTNFNTNFQFCDQQEKKIYDQENFNTMNSQYPQNNNFKNIYQKDRQPFMIIDQTNNSNPYQFQIKRFLNDSPKFDKLQGFNNEIKKQISTQENFEQFFAPTKSKFSQKIEKEPNFQQEDELSFANLVDHQIQQEQKQRFKFNMKKNEQIQFKNPIDYLNSVQKKNDDAMFDLSLNTNSFNKQNLQNILSQQMQNTAPQIIVGKKMSYLEKQNYNNQNKQSPIFQKKYFQASYYSQSDQQNQNFSKSAIKKTIQFQKQIQNVGEFSDIQIVQKKFNLYKDQEIFQNQQTNSIKQIEQKIQCLMESKQDFTDQDIDTDEECLQGSVNHCKNLLIHQLRQFNQNNGYLNKLVQCNNLNILQRIANSSNDQQNHTDYENSNYFDSQFIKPYQYFNDFSIITQKYNQYENSKISEKYLVSMNEQTNENDQIQTPSFINDRNDLVKQLEDAYSDYSD